MKTSLAALVLGASALALVTACSSEKDTAPTSDSAATDTTTSTPTETTADATETPFWLTAADMPESIVGEDGEIVRDEDNRPLGYKLLGKTLPDISGRLIDGTEWSTSALEGRWTVIDVWGIWCSDCMADAPYVAALAVALAQDPDVDFLSIHTPPSAERADEAYGKFGSVEAYFQSKGYSYPTVVDTDASLRNALKVDWTPTYLLVGPDLTIEGFTTDLSVSGDEPVKDLVRGIAEIRAAD